MESRQQSRPPEPVRFQALATLGPRHSSNAHRGTVRRERLEPDSALGERYLTFADTDSVICRMLPTPAETAARTEVSGAVPRDLSMDRGEEFPLDLEDDWTGRPGPHPVPGHFPHRRDLRSAHNPCETKYALRNRPIPIRRKKWSARVGRHTIAGLVTQYSTAVQPAASQVRLNLQ